jgi:putative ABC transport system permease protein
MALTQDLRYALRMFAKDRGTAALAVLTLAAGIGANTTLFSLVDALYLRPLPVPHAARVVHINELRANGDAIPASLPDYFYYREHSQNLEELAAHYPGSPMHVIADNGPVAITGTVATASYFDVLGITPQLGRFFTADEDRVPNRDAVVVVSHAFWQRQLNGDPRVLGRSILVNGRSFTVIGVTRQGFDGVIRGASSSQVWIPSAMFGVGYRYCNAFDRDCTIIDMMGRLKPSASIAQAQGEFDVLSRQLESQFPRTDLPRRIGVRSSRGVYPSQQATNISMVRLMLGGVGMLLAIACANVAGLMLARGLSRRKEITVRLALGAGRGRIVRQLLTESIMLTVAGSALGVLGASWAIDAVAVYYGTDYAGRMTNFDLQIGLPVLAATVVLCGVTAILCGMAPAIQAARTDVLPSLKLEGLSGRRRRTYSRDGLVMLQLAMSIVLLVGAALLIRSMIDLQRGPGIDADRVALLRLRPSLIGVSGERARLFQRAVIERLQSLPGIEAVAASENLPLFQGGIDVTVTPIGSGQPAAVAGVRSSHVGDRYFDVLGARMLAGRDFNRSDSPDSPKVAIADATLAASLGGADRAVGMLVNVGTRPYEIVGVVPSAQYHQALEPALPFLYLNYWQLNGAGFSADSRTHVRVSGDPAAMLPAMRAAIAAVDPNVPISEDYALSDRVAFNFKPVRMARSMLVIFGGLALMLSLVGLYGVVSSVASMRAREVAVRLALGASPGQIRALIAGHGLRLAIPGAILGAVAAFASTQVLRSLLYGVNPHDPATFVLVPLLLIAVALGATYGPVRRSTRVDPAVALRDE